MSCRRSRGARQAHPTTPVSALQAIEPAYRLPEEHDAIIAAEKALEAAYAAAEKAERDAGRNAALDEEERPLRAKAGPDAIRLILSDYKCTTQDKPVRALDRFLYENHRLGAQVQLQPLGCDQRMVQTAQLCLGSILGGLMKVPLWCTNDDFMRGVIQVDEALDLGVKMPEEPGTPAYTQEKIVEVLKKREVIAKADSRVGKNGRILTVKILEDPEGRTPKLLVDLLYDLLADELRKSGINRLTVHLKDPNMLGSMRYITN